METLLLLLHVVLSVLCDCGINLSLFWMVKDFGENHMRVTMMLQSIALSPKMLGGAKVARDTHRVLTMCADVGRILYNNSELGRPEGGNLSNGSENRFSTL